jgi:hypothetical protein
VAAIERRIMLVLLGLIEAAKSHCSRLRGLTFELTGRQRQDARARAVKMHRVPQTGPWWPAVAAPVERGVRHPCALLAGRVISHARDSASREAPRQEQSRYSASAALAEDSAGRPAPCTGIHSIAFLYFESLSWRGWLTFCGLQLPRCFARTLSIQLEASIPVSHYLHIVRFHQSAVATFRLSGKLTARHSRVAAADSLR